MKLTIEQIEELAGYMEYSLDTITDLLIDVTKDPQATPETHMDQEDWDALHELVDECQSCGHTVGVGDLYEHPDHGMICWRCEEDYGEEE